MFDMIYLSPHLDDAALSCGGRIFQQTAQGQRVLIVTIMAGEPEPGHVSEYAQTLHDRWELPPEVVAARRAEDVAACQILGADYLHLNIPDCIYRTDPESGRDLYGDWAGITGQIHPLEQNLIQDLVNQFAALSPHRQMIAPLAIGNHVDHQIVRQAAERCCGTRLVYYEDFPYSQDAAAHAAVIPPTSRFWRHQLIPLSEEAIQVKIKAIAAFTSQLSTFFDGRVDLEDQIIRHTNTIGGEQYWHYQIT
jgi:LmbE family N-acetylglucosaminyl deacetylase